MVDYAKQRKIDEPVVSAINIPTAINWVVGNGAAVVLTRPAGMKYLTVYCEVGAFRVKPGNFASLSNAAPAATISDDSGSIKLVPTDGRLTIPAPEKFSVRGVGASDVLVYFWS